MVREIAVRPNGQLAQGQQASLLNILGAAFGQYWHSLSAEERQQLTQQFRQAIESGTQTARNFISSIQDRAQAFGEQLQRSNLQGQREVQRRRDIDNNFEDWDLNAIQQVYDEIDQATENLQDSQMSEQQATEQAPEAQASMSMARSSAGGSNMPSKETPISIYPTLTYGEQDTHTTILPFTGWFTAAPLDNTAPCTLKIRCNAPFNMINGTPAYTVNANGNAAFTKGITSNRPAKQSGETAFNQYPIATTSQHSAAWTETWFRKYQYYTVLKCHIKITMVNPCDASGQHAIVGQDWNSYSTAAGATGNVTPETDYHEMLNFKNIQWKFVHPSTSQVQQGNSNFQIIEATWRPGTIKRNIVNDGDVKTWTKTYEGDSKQHPNIMEELALYFFNGGLFSDNDTSLTSRASGAVNMQVELKYVVQFKDLQAQIKWPNTLNYFCL